MTVKLPEPVACYVETEKQVMLWPIEDIDEAGTYCEENDSPHLLYTADQLKQAICDSLEKVELLFDVAQKLGSMDQFQHHLRAMKDGVK